MRREAPVSQARLDPVEAWKPWEPGGKDRLGLKWAGHLLRRAAFGATRDELHRAAAESPSTVLDRLFTIDPKLAGRDSELATQGREIAAGNNPFFLRGWWLDRMLNGGFPLREKMTLFWHNHFATSINKVQSASLMLRQNDLMRQHALGKFPPLLQQMSKEPAMLIWLDSNSNVKGKPNENYAREVMELFSLGVGNYTEKDIREAARAFTGWHTDGSHYTFKPDLHDEGSKTVLGQTGDWDGADVVRICLEQKACARFLVRKMYRFLVSEAEPPSDEFLEPLADAYRQSNYDTGAVVRRILSSRHFFSEHAYRQRVKSPVEYVLGLAKALGQGLVAPRALVGHLELMGQHLFAPPNVKGWEGGTAWLNTATIVVRHNLAYTLSLGGGQLNLGSPDPTGSAAIAIDPAALARRARVTEPGPLVSFYAELLLEGDLSTEARARLKEFLTAGEPEDFERDRRVHEMIHALLTTPEYQLA
jgi:uncharacterized protein (DUF1800 family)